MYTIAIVGGGPVGLSLARLLLTSPVSSRVSVTIFEKDASPTSRHSIGGALDLHPPTGLAAIQKMDLWDSFSRFARWEGEEMKICDKHGTIYHHEDQPLQIEGLESRPEIDRVRLMQVLLESVPDHVIQWGRELKEVVMRDGMYFLQFQDGSGEGPFDLLVGADGAWSKVRPALTDIRPQYSGIGGCSGVITPQSAGSQWDMVEKMVGKGSNFSFSDNKGLNLQRLGSGSVKISLHQRKELYQVLSMKDRYEKDEAGLKQYLLEEYKDWAATYQRCIQIAEGLWTTPYWELPYRDTFHHKPGITLIGDAAHLQTPFAGEGVNAGMKDALDLSVAIETALNGHKNMDDAIREFEESMFVRAEGVMSRTLANKDSMFAKDAPYSFLANYTAVMAKEAGVDLDKGAMKYVPATKMVYGLLWTWGGVGAMRRKLSDGVGHSKAK